MARRDDADGDAGSGEDDEGTEFDRSMVPTKKKVHFSIKQLLGLEARFRVQTYLSTFEKDEMAQNLGMTRLQVKTWFQNRR
jgi:hypothetical protein